MADKKAVPAGEPPQGVQMAMPSERDQIITFLLNSVDGKNNVIKQMQEHIKTLSEKAVADDEKIAALEAEIAAQTKAPEPPPAQPPAPAETPAPVAA